MLRIFDVTLARRFYIEQLGFTTDWEHRFADDYPLYTQISRGAVSLHLTEHHRDCCPGAKVYFEVEDVHGIWQEIASRNCGPVPPEKPRPTPWGRKEFSITDPFGNKLVFSENSK